MGGECLLDRFLPWSAAQEGLQLSTAFEHPVTVWAVLFDVLAMLLGLLLLVHGGKLTATVLFVIGFVSTAAIASAATSAILGALLHMSSCLLLSGLPLAAGLAGGLAVRQSPRTTFFVLGACVGGVLGLYVYSVIHLFLLYLLLIPAVAGGCLGLYWQSKILTAATAIVGAFSFMLGFTYLVLVPFDQRYARWLTPQAAQEDQYTLVPLLGAVALAMSGGALQKLWAKCEEGRGGGGFLDVPILQHLQRKKTRWERLKDWWSPPQAWWRLF